MGRHCERSEAIQTSSEINGFASSRSLSSGARSRDPFAPLCRRFAFVAGDADAIRQSQDGGPNAPHDPDFAAHRRSRHDARRTSTSGHHRALSILPAGQEFSRLEQLQLRHPRAVLGLGQRQTSDMRFESVLPAAPSLSEGRVVPGARVRLRRAEHGGASRRENADACPMLSLPGKSAKRVFTLDDPAKALR